MKRYFIFDKNLNLKKISSNQFILKKNKKTNYLLLAKYGNVGYYLIIPILLGLFLGFLIKKIVIGIIIGTIFSFYNLLRLIKANARD